MVELDDAEIKVHSALMRRRCPFFEGLFNGRAAGGWLYSRREMTVKSSDSIRIDLRHVDPKIFEYVLRYLYSDTGEDMFDEVVCRDLDDFLDVVTEVLSVANELMLDRLSQICQKMLGRFGGCTTSLVHPTDSSSHHSECLSTAQRCGTVLGHRIQRSLPRIHVPQSRRHARKPVSLLGDLIEHDLIPPAFWMI